MGMYKTIPRRDSTTEGCICAAAGGGGERRFTAAAHMIIGERAISYLSISKVR